MNNPVTSVYSTNLFHGTVGLLLAQSSGILLILHYRFQQVHTCNIKQIQFTIKVQRAAVLLDFNSKLYLLDITYMHLLEPVV